MSSSTDDQTKTTDTVKRVSSGQSYDSDNNTNGDPNYDKILKKYNRAVHDLSFLKCRYMDAEQTFHQLRKELECYNENKQAQTNRNHEQSAPEDTTITDHSIPYSFSSEDCGLKNEYDAIHSTNVDQINTLKEEINQLKNQCDELSKEQDNTFQERKQLKQQSKSAIRQLDFTFQERNDLLEVIKSVQLQHQEAVKEMKSAVASSVKSSKEFKQLSKMHDEIVKEYRHVVSERDKIHNDLEKLVGDFSKIITKNKELEKEIRFYKNEKITLQFFIESLKQEITSLLYDREEIFNEYNKSQDNFEVDTANGETQDDSKNYFDYTFSSEVENLSDAQRQVTSLDLFNSYQKNHIDNLDQANLGLTNVEIEHLRRLTDRHYITLDDLFKKLKIIKKHRNWAFHERDRIVKERDSIRIHSDTLRKQRDDALNMLAYATKDYDDLIKQKIKLAEELNNLKENIEVQLKKEDGLLLQLQAADHRSYNSSDMSIDLKDWNTEILNIDLGVVVPNEDLGINLVGGIENSLHSDDNGIYVSSINKESVASNKLRVNDCILYVNDLDCTSISKSFLIETINTLSHVSFIVKRKRPDTLSKILFATQLQGNPDYKTLLENDACTNQIIAAKNGIMDVDNNATEDIIQNSKKDEIPLHELDDSIVTTKSMCSTRSSSPRPNSRIYKKYINSATQTDSSSFLKYEEPCRKANFVQSTNDILDVPENLFRSSSPVNNSISEQHVIEELSDFNLSEPLSYVDSGFHRKSKELNKNSDAWPNIGIGPLDVADSSIILHADKNKNQSSLSILSNTIKTTNISDTPSIDFSVRSRQIYTHVMKEPCGNCFTRNEAGIIPAARCGPLMKNLWSQGGWAHNFQTFCGSANPRYPRPLTSYGGEPTMYCFAPHLSQLNHHRSRSFDCHHNIAAQKYFNSVNKINNIGYSGDKLPASNQDYEAVTFPGRMDNLRYRKFSNTSVANTSTGNASGKKENLSFKVDVLKPGQLPANKQKSLPDSWIKKYLKKPLLGVRKSNSLPGELRYITIDKSNGILGFEITCIGSGGVFISTVHEHSIALKVGLKVGDQLLEVCGINLRNATYHLAKNVLQQCGNSITLLVQHNPDNMI